MDGQKSLENDVMVFRQAVGWPGFEPQGSTGHAGHSGLVHGRKAVLYTWRFSGIFEGSLDLGC